MVEVTVISVKPEQSQAILMEGRLTVDPTEDGATVDAVTVTVTDAENNPITVPESAVSVPVTISHLPQ